MNKKDIENMIEEAVQLQRKGRTEEGLKILKKAEKETDNFPWQKKKKLKGLIFHYQGRLLHALKKYQEAVKVLNMAIARRAGDPIGKGYSMFQRYIAKVYGNIWIPYEETMETKKVLWKFIDVAETVDQMGQGFQNLAFIESQTDNMKKAIWFYHATEELRSIAEDQRGMALTQARLAECYKALGAVETSIHYSNLALEYFEKVGDVERINQIKEKVIGN